MVNLSLSTKPNLRRYLNLEIHVMEKALNNCCRRVRELTNQVSSLEKELQGEKQLRKKAEAYVKEVEGFLKESINKEVSNDEKGKK
tara:strand:- start:781 stop:1038 length:258 start_codon:yes stop_codon:yes gene_type:complete